MWQETQGWPLFCVARHWICQQPVSASNCWVNLEMESPTQQALKKTRAPASALMVAYEEPGEGLDCILRPKADKEDPAETLPGFLISMEIINVYCCRFLRLGSILQTVINNVNLASKSLARPHTSLEVGSLYLLSCLHDFPVVFSWRLSLLYMKNSCLSLSLKHLDACIS